MDATTRRLTPRAMAAVPEDVRADARTAVEFLAAIPGVTRIWLFGSGTGKRPQDCRSDLDIAVEGMAPGSEYRAWSELDQRLSGPLDLVRCEDASPLLLSEIKKGILLHEA